MRWRDLKGLLLVYAWAAFVLLLVYAFADGLSRFDEDGGVHSGARPDSRCYVGVDELENTLPPCAE